MPKIAIGGMSIGATDPKQLERIQQGLDPEDETKGTTPSAKALHPDDQAQITKYVSEQRLLNPGWKATGKDVELFRNSGYTDVDLSHFNQ